MKSLTKVAVCVLAWAVSFGAGKALAFGRAHIFPDPYYYCAALGNTCPEEEGWEFYSTYAGQCCCEYSGGDHFVCQFNVIIFQNDTHWCYQYMNDIPSRTECEEVAVAPVAIQQKESVCGCSAQATATLR